MQTRSQTKHVSIQAKPLQDEELKIREHTQQMRAKEIEIEEQHQPLKQQLEQLKQQLELERLSNFETKIKSLIKDVSNAYDRKSKIKIATDMYEFLDKEILVVYKTMQKRSGVEVTRRFMTTIYLKGRYLTTTLIEMWENAPSQHISTDIYKTEQVFRRVIEKIKPLII
jgi:glutamate-1-semialdehyde aminotransferase